MRLPLSVFFFCILYILFGEGMWLESRSFWIKRCLIQPSRNLPLRRNLLFLHEYKNLYLDNEMEIKIPYGEQKKKLDLSEDTKVEMVFPKKVSLSGRELTIKKSLDNAFGCGSFEKWIKRKENILFVVNDATRPTPAPDILTELDKKMDIGRAKYIVATGAHKEPDDRGLQLIFGEFYERIKSNIILHNAKNKKSLAKLGITKKGTQVWINKEVLQAKALIAIGSVEPHYFAGFTGGRKSFFPGLAGYVTIEQNHKLALDNGAEVFRLEGNPVQLDLLDAFKMIPDVPLFSVQTIVIGKQDLYSVFCGNIHESFYRAAESVRSIFSFPVKEKADIVITVAKPPLDKNLYQAHKAIENGKLALKDGGVLILVAPCLEGIGFDNFYKLLSSSDDPEEIIKKARENYKLGYHKAARIAELSKKAELYLFSEIGYKTLKDTFLKSSVCLQDTVEKAMAKGRESVKIIIIDDGGNMVPVEEEK